MKNLHRGAMFILAVLVSVATGNSTALAQSGPAWVVSVDRPEMCLRIRNGPGLSYPVIGCAAMGSRVNLTGVWSNNHWAEINRPMRGWVSDSQIRIVVAGPPPPVGYDVTIPPAAPCYYGPAYEYGPVWNRYYRRHRPCRGWRRRPYNRGGCHYRGHGVGVCVGPRGGFSLRLGGVGVRVGPRGGVGVRVR
jgi:uncharacterized protein YraI